MNRVEIVNLGGRTYQIETAGAAAIDAWLASAARSLNGDPDRDDLLLDFERAIGEKCEAGAVGGRNVVTTEQVAAILESLGTIEPSGVGELALASGQLPVDRTRRLFRLPDERMIAGVCAGVAAWLGVDVTVVRVLWAGLPILTLGLTDGASAPLFVGLYVVLAVVLPRASSPEAKAAARGRGTTAQDVLVQARSGAMPALSMVGTRIGSIIRLAMRVVKGALLLAITALLAAWVVGAGWLAVAGDPLLGAFGSEVSRWLVPAFFACLAVIAIAPLMAGAALLDHAIRASAEGRWPQGHLTAWLLSATGAWVAALGMAAVLIASIPGVRDVVPDGDGRIFFMGTTFCFVASLDSTHCRPGDELLIDRHNEPLLPAQPGRPRPPAPLPPIAPLQPETPAQPVAPVEQVPSVQPAQPVASPAESLPPAESEPPAEPPAGPVE